MRLLCLNGESSLVLPSSELRNKEVPSELTGTPSELANASSCLYYHNKTFSCGKMSTQSSGGCDPATNVQVVKLTSLNSTGTIAPRKEPPSVSCNRIWLGSCLLESIVKGA
jgi:hypothetical protein